MGFWITAVAIPLVVIVMNVVVRWALKAAQSTAADLVIAMILFDIAVIDQTEIYKEHMTLGLSVDELRLVFVMLLLVNIAMWVVAIAWVEKAIEAAYDYDRRRYRHVPVGPISASL